MKKVKMTRRSFLKTTAAGTAGIVLAGPSVISGQSVGPLRIKEPFHGAILNHRHGQQAEDGLKIRVSGKAPLKDTVKVNGVPASRAGADFNCDIVLRDKQTDIIATSDGVFGRGEHRVRVLWDRYSQPRYRFSIDDNSFFLRDVAQKNYKSLFDCFYLNTLQQLHSKYGTRFVLNIYYTTADGFDLTKFPDRYKSQWQDNSDWLKLAFHAYANDPDRPYQYASAEKLASDFDLVAEQILRFAGEQTYSPPTVIHWAMVQPSALKVLVDRGVRVLSGFFEYNDGLWDINYFLDDDRSEYISRHDALMDFGSGIIFSKTDIVCNNVPVEQIVPTLEPLSRDPNCAEIMDIFTHEQYFWPFYHTYLPDHPQRLETAIKWLTENGYKPVFFHEGFLGGRE